VIELILFFGISILVGIAMILFSLDNADTTNASIFQMFQYTMINLVLILLYSAPLVILVLYAYWDMF
jgi:hypothetical protein